MRWTGVGLATAGVAVVGVGAGGAWWASRGGGPPHQDAASDQVFGEIVGEAGGVRPAVGAQRVALLAAWSQIVPSTSGGAVEARWVLPGAGQDCTAWKVSGAGAASVAGAKRGTPSQTFGAITVCWAPLPSAWATATLDDGSGSVHRALPGWKHAVDAAGNGQPAVVIGDSGCRQSGKVDEPGATCTAKEWGLSGVVAKIGSTNTQPAMFVHVGDYRYADEDLGQDTWAWWQYEWFAPTAPLASLAPWSLARGNHESCTRHGEGWFLLFGPSAPADASDSTHVTACVPAHPTWSFDLKVGSANHRFVVVDTSSESKSTLVGPFKDALNASAAADHAWWVQHHPLLYLLSEGSGRQSLDTPSVRDAFGLAFATVRPSGSTLCTTASGCAPRGLIVGHEHQYGTVRIVTPGGTVAWPEQHVVGNGGVELRGGGLSAQYCDADLEVQQAGVTTAYEAALDYHRAFGFLQMTLQSSTGGAGATWNPVFVTASAPGSGTPPACAPKEDHAKTTWALNVPSGESLGLAR